MKGAKKKGKRVQSNLSRALASSNRVDIVHDRFFNNLSSGEIRRSVASLTHHRHFSDALQPNRLGAISIYRRHTPSVPFEKNLAWCLGLLESHQNNLQHFLDRQNILLSLILSEKYDEALIIVRELETKLGISSWGVSLQGTLLALTSPGERRAYISEILSASKENNFFKALTTNLVGRFDNPETLESESRFFEQKVRRTFTGTLLHFLIYKLVPENVGFEYNFQDILDFEKDSSPVDILVCLIDFLTLSLRSENIEINNLCKRTLSDLRRQLQGEALDNLAVAYGLIPPAPITPEAITILDLYTSGNYREVCETMNTNPTLGKEFTLVEIWAKSLARTPSSTPSPLAHLLTPLSSIVTKSNEYGSAKAVLLAYSHAFAMFPWFREMRYLLERETRFYDTSTNERLRQASLLLSTVTTPAKLEVLTHRCLLAPDLRSSLVPQDSVTARLFSRMLSPSTTEPTDIELAGIEKNRRLKFRAAWNLVRERHSEAIILLDEILQSQNDTRATQDASRSLVDVYLITGQIEKAADVYVQAVLSNPHLLSAFNGDGIAKACSEIVGKSKTISVPIVLSLHSRFIGAAYDAALKYSFECFLKSNNIVDPRDLFKIDYMTSREGLYFLQYICTPEVMKLYLYFNSQKEIELCRIEICKSILTRSDVIEDIIFEIKDRTRRLVIWEAASQVHGSRIFSDVNLLSGTSSGAFKSLFDRYRSLKEKTTSVSEDEEALKQLLEKIQGDAILIKNAHVIHIQDIVLNEKNTVFLKLLKLVRDEFAFGDKGLNVYLSTRIRHGHFPNTIRKPLLDNGLLAAKARDTAGYKMAKDWQSTLRPNPQCVQVLEQAIVDFSVKFNELVDLVNDKWLRVFTIDPDIAGLSKDGEIGQSLFNYSLSSVEAYRLQTELGEKSSFNDFVAIAEKWLWSRTEMNLASIREKIAEEMQNDAMQLLENLGRAVIDRFGIDQLGDFPDALVRARNGLGQAFETVQGWFSRARSGGIKSFDLEIPVQIARMAADVSVTLHDTSGITWKGELLNPLVDAFYILFENAVSKSRIQASALNLSVTATVSDEIITIRIQNRCESIEDVREANEGLERYRTPGTPQALANAAQGEGGSGFFKLWRLLSRDMNVSHTLNFGYVDRETFLVEIATTIKDCQKGADDEGAAD